MVPLGPLHANNTAAKKASAKAHKDAVAAKKAMAADKASAMAAHKSFVSGAISHYNSGNF
jgi:hypothetical protein